MNTAMDNSINNPNLFGENIGIFGHGAEMILHEIALS
jgi:hypothetical protein